MASPFFNDELNSIPNDELFRLFHVIVQDDVLPSFLNLEEEGVFSSQLDLWANIANRYNDKLFVPTSYYLPSLHPDFKFEKDLPSPEVPQNVQDLFAVFTKAKSRTQALQKWCFTEFGYENKKVKPTIVSLLREASTNEKLSSLNVIPSNLLYLWHLDDTFCCLNPVPKAISEMAKAMGEKDGARSRMVDNKMSNFEESFKKLASAELHHSKMVKQYTDLVTKINTVGGKEYETLVKVIDDIFKRVNASYARCCSIETSILMMQQQQDEKSFSAVHETLSK